MAETAFNTIAEVQRLRDAGFEQKQAEAITLSIHAGVTGGVATKADLEKVEDGLSAEIALVRTELDNTAKSLRSEIGKVEERLGAKIDTEVASVRTEIASVRGEIATAKYDLTWRLIGAIAVLNGILFAALRYLPPSGN